MIILSISLTTVLLLLVDNSSEPQFLQSKVFPSEISSLNDIRDSLEGVLDDNPWFIKYIQKKLIPPAPQNSSLKLHKKIHTGQVSSSVSLKTVCHLLINTKYHECFGSKIG